MPVLEFGHSIGLGEFVAELQRKIRFDHHYLQSSGWNCEAAPLCPEEAYLYNVYSR